jgi:hypothetical protein
MKLCNETVELIRKVINVGNAFNVEVFVINKEGIRAKSDTTYVFLSEKRDLDFLEFDSLCIARVGEFNKRLRFMDKLSGGDECEIGVSSLKELDDGTNMVYKLQMLAESTVVEVGGTESDQYKLPWMINDTNIVSFTFGTENVDAINGLSRVVQGKNKSINIKCVDGVIIATSTDVEGDRGTHMLSVNPEFVDTPEDFSFMYNIDTLMPILKNSSTMKLTVTSRGIMTTKVEGMDAMVFSGK